MVEDQHVADVSRTRENIHAELDRAIEDFSRLIAGSSDGNLNQSSDGTRWTNRQTLFHMLFGYLITRNLRLIVKTVSRLPAGALQMFARQLDSAALPFHHVNYWGSCAGARVLAPRVMARWMNRVIISLHRHLDGESDSSLARSMPFPAKWDPYFTTQ
jgi:hypothetical protein